MINYSSFMLRAIVGDFRGQRIDVASRARFYSLIRPNNSNVMEESLLLINFRGNIMPMTSEEYQNFLETIDEWDN